MHFHYGPLNVPLHSEDFVHQPQIGSHVFGHNGKFVAGGSCGKRREQDELVREVAIRGRLTVQVFKQSPHNEFRDRFRPATGPTRLIGAQQASGIRVSPESERCSLLSRGVVFHDFDFRNKTGRLKKIPAVLGHPPGYLLPAEMRRKGNSTDLPERTAIQ